MTSLAPSDLRPTEAHGEVRLGAEPIVPSGPVVPHSLAGPHSQAWSGSLGAPHRWDLVHTHEGPSPLGDSSPAPCGPIARRSVSAGPDMSLGPLGWLAVLLVAALLTVLAHAGSVRSGQAEHREPSPVTDSAYVARTLARTAARTLARTMDGNGPAAVVFPGVAN